MVFILYIMFRNPISTNTAISKDQVIVTVSYHNVDMTKNVTSDKISYTICFKNFSKSMYQLSRENLDFNFPLVENVRLMKVVRLEYSNTEYADIITYHQSVNRDSPDKLEDFDLMEIFIQIKNFRKKFIKFVQKEVKNKNFDFNNALNTFLNIEGYNHIIKNFK